MSLWYHGTGFGNEIRESGTFKVSGSGGGNRGLRGAWFTQDKSYAKVYANALREKSGDPEILVVEIADDLKLMDFREAEASVTGHMELLAAQWMLVGVDIYDAEVFGPIRATQPFALTKVLVKKRYHGAIIPNTVEKGDDASPELVIFNPQNINIIGSESID